MILMFLNKKQVKGFTNAFCNRSKLESKFFLIKCEFIYFFKFFEKFDFLEVLIGG